MVNAAGKIVGRTSTIGFDFLIEQLVKKWDYITVQHVEVGSVLAQVREIIKKDHQTMAHCEIIGYRTDRGFLRKPRTPLEPGAPVYLAHDDFLKSTLGLTDGGLYLGLLEGKDNLKAFINPKRLVTQHLAILARSGSGKSYAIGVLLEELMELKVPIIVLDPHGEYSTIKNPNKQQEDMNYFQAYGISAKGYRQQVREFAVNTSVNMEAEQLKLSIPDNPMSLIQAIPFKITNTQRGLLYNVIDGIRTKKAKFDFNDIIEELTQNESPSKWNLITGLQNLQSTRLFSFQPTDHAELVKPGQLTIINLKGAPVDLQEMVVASLASALFECRKLNRIPPFFMVVEEAHTFCPERGFGEALSSRILRTISSEGRKFGLGLGIISQRSARVDKSIISQTASQIILQVTNPNDLKAISSSFEGVSSETEEEVKNLPIGKALVVGAADYPIFVDIRVRKSQHGGRAQTFEFSKSATNVSSYAPSTLSTAPSPVYTPIVSQEEREPVTHIETELPRKSAIIEPENSGMTLSFAPRIMPKDIVMMENEDVEKTSMILRPCISIHGRKGTKEGHIVVDAINFGIYIFEDKLKFIEIPAVLQELSEKQKLVIKATSAEKMISISEVFSKSKLSYAEVSMIISGLVKQGILQTDGKQVRLRPDLQDLGKLERIHFPDKPEYVDLPAKKLPVKLNEKQIDVVLKALGVEASSKIACFMPFYHVQFKNGKSKIVDAMSYSLGN